MKSDNAFNTFVAQEALNVYIITIITIITTVVISYTFSKFCFLISRDNPYLQ